MKVKTHTEIIHDAGGVAAVRNRLGLPADRHEMVKSWWVRNRIPGEYWRRFSEEGIASLVDLALAAELRRRPSRAA